MQRTIKYVDAQTVTDPPQSFYDWSDPANWSNGIPVNGDSVLDSTALPPAEGSQIFLGPSTDNLLNLALNTLSLTNDLEVTSPDQGPSSLTIQTLIGLPGAGTTASVTAVSFGDDPFPATVTITGSISGPVQIGAQGMLATADNATPSDPGLQYVVADGGEVILGPTPSSHSVFDYLHSNSPYFFDGNLDAGIFAFQNPGSIVSAQLLDIGPDDAIALPGSKVLSAQFTANSISITTNLGTTLFNNVQFLASEPVGYTVSTDPTGLLRFAPNFADAIQYVDKQVIGQFPMDNYFWSDPANWTIGLPANGGSVTDPTVLPAAEGSQIFFGPSTDDLQSLSLVNLSLHNGLRLISSAQATSSLTVQNLIGLPGAGTIASIASIVSDADSQVPFPTVLTITGTVSGPIEIGAEGLLGTTDDEAAFDPGERYEVIDGAELILAALPSANSVFEYVHGLSGPFFQPQFGAGTFAFKDPGSVVSAELEDLQFGDSIALPGSKVLSAQFGPNSISITTNLGTTLFNNVQFGGSEPDGYTVSTDPSGLLRFTPSFADAIQYVDKQVMGQFPMTYYFWGDAANWTNGVPVNGGSVTDPTVLPAAEGSQIFFGPSTDNLQTLSLVNLSLHNGLRLISSAQATSSLTVQTLIGLPGSGTMASIVSDADSQVPFPTVLTITGTVSGPIEIGAEGYLGTTDDEAASDPGERYEVIDSAELILAAQPSANSVFEYVHGPSPPFFQPQSPAGTFAFKDPGSVVSAELENLQSGDSIALPGSTVLSAQFGPNSISITTELGTTLFNNVQFLGNVPTGYITATDPTGLLQFVPIYGSYMLPPRPGGEAVRAPGYGNVITGGNVSVALTGPLGNTQVTLGNGTDTLSLGGYGNVITLGTVTGTVVNAGVGNESVTIAAGAASVMAGGYNDVFSLGGGNFTLGGWAGGASITLGAAFGAGSTLDLLGTAGDRLVQSGGRLLVVSPGGPVYATISAPPGVNLNGTMDAMGGVEITGGPAPVGAPASFTGLPYGGSVINTGAANGTVTLFGYNNSVTGGNGNNTVTGSLGNDTLHFGDGNNTIVASGYNDNFVLGNGNNTVTGPLGNSVILAGNGLNSISFAGYGNTISTGSGTDTIVAGAGNDTVNAGTGHDVISLAGYDNVVTVGAGQESVAGGLYTDFKVTGAGHAGGLSIAGFGGSGGLLDLSAALAALGTSAAVQVAASGSDSLVSITASGGTYLVADLHGTGGASLTGLLSSHSLII